MPKKRLPYPITGGKIPYHREDKAMMPEIQKWMFRKVKDRCDWFSDRFLGKIIEELDGRVPIGGSIVQILFSLEHRHRTTTKAAFYLVSKNGRTVPPEALWSIVAGENSSLNFKQNYLPCQTIINFTDQCKLPCCSLDDLYGFFNKSKTTLVVDIERKTEEVNQENKPVGCKPLGAMRIVFPGGIRAETDFDFDVEKENLHFLGIQGGTIEYLTDTGIKICDMRTRPDRHDVLAQYVKRACVAADGAENFINSLFTGNSKLTNTFLLNAIADFTDSKTIKAEEILSPGKIGSDKKSFNLRKRVSYKNTIWSEDYHQRFDSIIFNPCYLVVE